MDILRSFFLLARGELFQEFIEEADTFLNKPPNAATEYDIRQCFVSTIRKLLADDEDLVAKIKGQLISECLFDVSNFPKFNEKI